jgi:hypothetical protein
MATRKSALAAAIVGGAIALAAGCTTEEIDQTAPPYASTSDQARYSVSAPTPAPSVGSSDSGGVMSAIGTVIMFPVHLIGQAFGSNSN